MRGIARGFFTAAIVYGVLGMALGLHMAVAQNHGQMPTHAHIMVIGWLSFAVFGVFYYLLGKAVPRVLSLTHFWLAQVSMAGLMTGLFLIYSGRVQFEPVAAISASLYALSFVVFAIGALSAMRDSPVP